MKLLTMLAAGLTAALISLMTGPAQAAAAPVAAGSAALVSAGYWCPQRRIWITIGQPRWNRYDHGYGYGHGRKPHRVHRVCSTITYRDHVHGRWALVQAQQCRDGYGRSYVVRGSEVVLRWYR